MCRRRTGTSEVRDTRDDTPIEVTHPDLIYGNTRGQRMIGLRQPFSECEPPPGCSWKWRDGRVILERRVLQYRGNARFERIPESDGVAATKQIVNRWLLVVRENSNMRLRLQFAPQRLQLFLKRLKDFL